MGKKSSKPHKMGKMVPFSPWDHLPPNVPRPVKAPPPPSDTILNPIIIRDENGFPTLTSIKSPKNAWDMVNNPLFEFQPVPIPIAPILDNDKFPALNPIDAPESAWDIINDPFFGPPFVAPLPEPKDAVSFPSGNPRPNGQSPPSLTHWSDTTTEISSLSSEEEFPALGAVPKLTKAQQRKRKHSPELQFARRVPWRSANVVIGSEAAEILGVFKNAISVKIIWELQGRKMQGWEWRKVKECLMRDARARGDIYVLAKVLSEEVWTDEIRVVNVITEEKREEHVVHDELGSGWGEDFWGTHEEKT
jgi:hypothetical protein